MFLTSISGTKRIVLNLGTYMISRAALQYTYNIITVWRDLFRFSFYPSFIFIRTYWRNKNRLYTVFLYFFFTMYCECYTIQPIRLEIESRETWERERERWLNATHSPNSIYYIVHKPASRSEYIYTSNYYFSVISLKSSC